MENSQPQNIAAKMRLLFEQYHKDMTGCFLGRFPEDSCEPASTLAYLGFKSLGFENITMWRGDYDDGDGAHYWIEVNCICIDMTYDQEAIKGKQLCGFSVDDEPYSKWPHSKVPESTIQQNINRFKLRQDLTNFLSELNIHPTEEAR